MRPASVLSASRSCAQAAVAGRSRRGGAGCACCRRGNAGVRRSPSRDSSPCRTDRVEGVRGNERLEAMNSPPEFRCQQAVPLRRRGRASVRASPVPPPPVRATVPAMHAIAAGLAECSRRRAAIASASSVGAAAVGVSRRARAGSIRFPPSATAWPAKARIARALMQGRSAAERQPREQPVWLRPGQQGKKCRTRPCASSQALHCQRLGRALQCRW